MRIAVDHDMCTGHGRCYTLAPDVLDYDDEGFVTIRGKQMEVPAGQEGLMREIILACPEGAISDVSPDASDADTPDAAG